RICVMVRSFGSVPIQHTAPPQSTYISSLLARSAWAYCCHRVSVSPVRGGSFRNRSAISISRSSGRRVNASRYAARTRSASVAHIIRRAAELGVEVAADGEQRVAPQLDVEPVPRAAPQVHVRGVNLVVGRVRAALQLIRGRRENLPVQPLHRPAVLHELDREV